MKQESPLDGVAPDHREVGQGRPRGGEEADGSKRSIGRDVRNPVWGELTECLTRNTERHER